jgi:hypothetical protein
MPNPDVDWTFGFRMLPRTERPRGIALEQESLFAPEIQKAARDGMRRIFFQ